MAVRLSKRLTALAGMVTEGNRLADIGTDHGYIPVYLCQKDKIPSAIAMDIGEGPLSAAKEHILEYGLIDRIQTRLSDGLEKLNPGEVDTILIAGMGGGLVIKILSEGRHVLCGTEEMILQPQSEISRVRKFLREEGFSIVDEDMIEEDGKFYPMMKVCQGCAQDMPKKMQGQYDPAFGDEFGPVLLAKRNTVLLSWVERELKISDQILRQIAGQPSKEAALIRAQEISSRKEQLLQAFNILT